MTDFEITAAMPHFFGKHFEPRLKENEEKRKIKEKIATKKMCFYSAFVFSPFLFASQNNALVFPFFGYRRTTHHLERFWLFQHSVFVVVVCYYLFPGAAAVSITENQENDSPRVG